MSEKGEKEKVEYVEKSLAVNIVENPLQVSMLVYRPVVVADGALCSAR
jgi:hypothetical protein